jgi:membrane-associated phospholipid phosphatase
MGARDASDVLVLTLLASPVALAISDVGREQASTIGLMYMETFLVSNGLTQLLKGLTSRTRPYAYNDDPGIPEEDKQHIHAVRSFPSGHTSNAFAAAVFLSSTYSKLHPHSPARTWVWLGSLTAASTVGYLRYRAGQHYPTDVIAGAILGASMGFLVPKLHEVGPVYVAPTDGGLAIGTVLSF